MFLQPQEPRTMYVLPKHAENRLDVLHALMAAHPLGMLVTQGGNGLAADHIPFEIAPATDAAPLGVLRAHVARANPLWRLAGTNVLAVFQGPHAYISPALFGEKAISGKVVPTWDYAVVHAHGTLAAVDDKAWLLALVNRLTDEHERTRRSPWAVGDAPDDYIDAMSKAIVGVEIPIARLEGKWKLNQTNPLADQQRMAADLATRPATAPLGELIRQRLGEST
jgi:transcriptional regulator